MVLKASTSDAYARRHQFVTPSGASTYVSTYIGTNKMELLAQGQPLDSGRSGPMAYLVEQAPLSTVEPHFHEVDQFQLFVGGSGRIGTHALAGVIVHFAGPHSPYGPIVSGPEGVRYVTLRREWDPGAQWMPDGAARLRSIADRTHIAFTSPPLDLYADTAQLQGTSSSEILSPQECGGAGAWLLRGGPGTQLRTDAAGTNGRFWYLLSGALQAADGNLGPGTCVFISEEEPAVEFPAGPAGVELVQVQFPLRVQARTGQDPTHD